MDINSKEVSLAFKAIGYKVWHMQKNKATTTQITGFNVKGDYIVLLSSEWKTNGQSRWETEELCQSNCFATKQELLDSL